MGFNFAIIFAPGTLEAAPYTLMATVAPPSKTSTVAFERKLTADLPMVSAIRVSDIVAQVKALLESIDGAVRIATGFAILMGMIVLAGSVVATRRRAAPRHRPAAPGRRDPRRGRAKPVDRVRLAVGRGGRGRASRPGTVAAWLVVVAGVRIPVQPRLDEPGADPVGRDPAGRVRRFCWRQFRRLTRRPAEGLRGTLGDVDFDATQARFRSFIATERNSLWLQFPTLSDLRMTHDPAGRGYHVGLSRA